VKLLRVLESGMFTAIGASDATKSTARVVTATHRDLRKQVEEGKFREDLFYRLDVMTIEIPPLRERPEDIRPLTLRFVHEFNRDEGRQIRYVAKDAMELLENAHWPGNVRQLRNEIHRAVLIAEGDRITRDLILERARPRVPVSDSMTPDEYLSLPWTQAKGRVLEAFAHLYLRHHLNMSGGNITAAAESAGMARPNLSRLLRRFGLR